MTFQTRALSSLRSARSRKPNFHAWVGLDGFVDTIVTPVGQRTGKGEAFTAISSIPEFSQRIAGAAGKSTNIEFYPRMEKLGGNGPIMANALISAGVQLTYVGALGHPRIHPVFQPFSQLADVFTLCDPGMTTAVEFGDGKLMFGQLRSLDNITLPAIEAAIGKATLHQQLASADLIALVNWTMIPNMTEIFRSLVDDVFPSLPPRPERIFFFDLADPEKRTQQDLIEVLSLLSRFESFGKVTLGLNLKEAQRVYKALGFSPLTETEQDLRQIASEIRSSLSLSTVVVHPRESAACASDQGTFWIPGPYTSSPMITTGAGDHFNAGFSVGQMLGLDPEGCLSMGVCTSGIYVRTAQSPTLDQIEQFLNDWV